MLHSILTDLEKDGIVKIISRGTRPACIRDILAKASAKGVKLGCFADTVEGGKKWRDLGVRFIGYSCDTCLFYQKAKEDVMSFA